MKKLTLWISVGVITVGLLGGLVWLVISERQKQNNAITSEQEQNQTVEGRVSSLVDSAVSTKYDYELSYDEASQTLSIAYQEKDSQGLDTKLYAPTNEQLLSNGIAVLVYIAEKAFMVDGVAKVKLADRMSINDGSGLTKVINAMSITVSKDSFIRVRWEGYVNQPIYEQLSQIADQFTFDASISRAVRVGNIVLLPE